MLDLLDTSAWMYRLVNLEFNLIERGSKNDDGKAFQMDLLRRGFDHLNQVVLSAHMYYCSHDLTLVSAALIVCQAIIIHQPAHKFQVTLYQGSFLPLFFHVVSSVIAQLLYLCLG